MNKALFVKLAESLAAAEEWPCFYARTMKENLHDLIQRALCCVHIFTTMLRCSLAAS